MLRRSLGLLCLVMIGCAQGAPVEDPPPFPEDTDDGVEPTTGGGTTTFPLDTGFDEPQDDAPDHWLHVTHTGVWNLSGSPYSSLGGTLQVVEIVDELATDEVPDCELQIAMTGALPDEETYCTVCDFVFDVEFFVGSGNAGACRDPELPPNGAIWRMGYSSSEAAVMLNYDGSGIWVPWYPATKVGDTVTFEWQISLGVEVEEEE